VQFVECPIQSIYAWLDYRAKKADKSLIRGKDNFDPFTSLIENLTGSNKKPSKLLAGWQHWSKAHFEDHKADFETDFKTSGAPENQRATARQAFIRNLFKALPVDVQQRHEESAIEEHAAAVKAFKERRAAPPSKSPQDRQAAIDRLGGVVRPIIEGIAEATGMQVTMIVGGPEPRKGGQLNVIRLVHFVNDGQIIC
jgi:hypothetical protein